MSELYTIPANTRTPMLIIYLLDISKSMDDKLGNRSRIEIVRGTLEEVVLEMVARSMRGSTVQRRYRIAMFAYADSVYDMLEGVWPIDELAEKGVPKFTPGGGTNTAAAFVAAESLLIEELQRIQGCPAPLVCHMTDGEFGGRSALPAANRIREMRTDDGPVLIENIFLSDRVLKKPVEDVHSWQGVREEDIEHEYARTLLRMSSSLPESYLAELRKHGYSLPAGAPMMFPGENEDLIRLAFTVSAATGVG
jgi:uncharacterized protein YegL